MDIIKLVLIFTVILTAATKVGFIIQRTYFDIKGIALSALLATITAFVTSSIPFICVMATLTIYSYLLCKIGRISLLPDVLLATMIGYSTLIVVMIDYLKDFNILFFWVM